MLPPLFLWMKAPLIRLLIPLIAGILLQWHDHFSLFFLQATLLVSLGGMLLFFLFPVQSKYKFSYFIGISTNLFIACAGSILIRVNDIRNSPYWIGNVQHKNDLICVTLEGAVEEKPNSYKGLAAVNYLYDQKIGRPLRGYIIIYFEKKPAALRLTYGSRLIFNKFPQTIQNTGNPGSFNEARFYLFQSVTHRVFLTSADYVVLQKNKVRFLQQFIIDCRQWVLSSLQKNIHGIKELGLAEALLVGYKYDLDHSLVQAYAKTGVVHIIAISGMHLALIYGMLVWLTGMLKKITWLRVLIILMGLWLFTLMAGAQASVVRSCVMFTCLAMGSLLKKKLSVYNTLALSAFLLLCYNPFWLWDVGFQLSYTAVVSIVIFYRKIYRRIFLQNRLLDAVWKTMAVSIAAQIVTTPVSLYYFHQFPVLFLVTNLVAVPLSGIILFGEIILCACSWYGAAAQFGGHAVSLLIGWMNNYIERIDKVSFAAWSGISISMLQVMLMFLFIFLLYNWLTKLNKAYLFWSLFTGFIIMANKSFDTISAEKQQKIIVYDIPKHSALEIISGRTCAFICDVDLVNNQSLLNFHITPSRMLHKITKETRILDGNDITFKGKHLAFLDRTFLNYTDTTRKRFDLVIFSNKTKNSMLQFNSWFHIRLVILDSSIPSWKANQWKKECDALRIPYYDVVEKGAFVMNL